MPISPRIRIVIVDDHAMTRTGLRYFLKAFDDMELVGEASHGHKALEICGQTQPDVVLMDMMMPELNGVEVTKMILERFPHIQIIALTSFQENALVEQALKAGVISYLLKNVSAKELAKAIRAAYAGRSILAQEVTGAVIAATRQDSKLGDNLTQREQEVLALLIEGFSNAQIAKQLLVSEATAKYHVRNILNKLNAASRAEAVSLAWQHNLISN